MDKSWMRTSRTKKQYIDGVEAFIKIDISYTKWDKHGENDKQAITAQIPVNATTEFVDDTDFDMDFGLEIPTYGPTTVEMVNATKESFDEDDLANFQELLLDAEKPLYKGCPDFTKLFAIVKLLNLKGKYRASDKFLTELLGLLKKMLPAGNKMVEKTYQAKKLMRMMGSGYKKIHVCSNNCILYWKDNKELTVCPTYGIARWKVDNKIHKVRSKMAHSKEDNRWCFTSPIDSQAWRTIDEKFPKIAKDLRNLRLGTSADGVGVNSRTRHHSVWPVLSVIYNLPPWLYMKRKFIVLSVLISGYSGNDIDVFLELLVDDLHTLFETGVDTYDASIKENFNLQLGIKPELFARQEEDKTTLPPAGYTVMNAEKDSFCETLSNIRVERELAISKDSVSETVRWISYGHEAYNINGCTFCTKSNDGIFYQNSGVSVEAVDLHISKEVETTRKAFYYEAGGVKHDPNMGYTLVDLNTLGHKDDPFILSSQERQVFYVKDRIDKKLSIVFRTPIKNYKDTYDEVDKEFSIVIHEHNDNILPRVNRHDLGNETQNDYYQTDCEEPIQAFVLLQILM
nr:hypothetical protein [Tanacetum cinerariifolium]